MMFSIPDFLDRAKRGAGVGSDYALGKVTGLGKANVSNWRNEKTVPEVPAIIVLCRYSGDDPEHVAACIQSMRAANDDAADLWRRVAARLKGANVIALGVSAAVLIALLPDPAQASELHAGAAAAGSLYIMSNVMRRLAMRLWRRMTNRRAALSLA